MSFAATLRHKVLIQERTAGSDDQGQPIDTWTTVAQPWADIRTTGGLETIKAGAVTSTVNASIRLRHRAGLNAGMRVVHGATTYNVLAVLPDLQRKIHIDLVCEVIK
ncbi:phage head closure protein [Rugamonas sp. DEMB1]|uniref:phage head closure protein n=1 Tax=Rugamonas sp. DEMB1 TaxID=3039386 RepID=UPI00244D0E36|nr:phage head closure protein [Rugamonas sp. DEMB1]WGG48926.1 phage head closure protein [Rugamonas sp. DEMB1]